VHLVEASSLVQLDFRKSNFFAFKLEQVEFWTGTSGTGSGFLVFWYQQKLGFHFSGVLSTEKVR
jgi:hypothetical protein